MKYRKKKKVLIYHVPLLALLLSLCLPTISLKAANWNADKIEPTATLTKDDTITCKKTTKITINYYASDGTTLIYPYSVESDKVTISERTDNANNVYRKYTVSSIMRSENELQISLTGIPVPSYSPVKLVIDTPPSKTTYVEGDSFDPKDMVVQVFYSDGRLETITNYKISPSRALTTSDTIVTISYTDDGNVTQSATQKITVNAKTPDEDTHTNAYVISASAAAGGSISDAGGHSVNRGDSKTYTISPDYGYRINYVEVDGNNVGAVSSYTFYDVQENHSISAYFLSGSAASQNNAAKRNLTVVGSFAAASGAGSYLPGTKVTVDAGFVPGFAFAGWIASDGIIYPLPAMSYVMPSYDVLLYANWVQSGAPNALSQITTTNLKGQQLTSWAQITNKLATFSANDLNKAGSPVMKATAGGINCYIDAAAIAMLNTRQGIALDVSYGPDASFTFYSDMDNSQFTGTDLTYACSTSTSLFFHEKSLVFSQPGAINTGICLNVSLPDAQVGQTAYVYLVNEKGTEIMYLPAIVDAEKKIAVPLSAKINLNIKY